MLGKRADLRATCPETVGDTIYQAADITYVIKDDPEAAPILIHGMANYFRKPAGSEEAGKIARFEVYLDSLSLVKRMEEVELAAAARTGLPRVHTRDCVTQYTTEHVD